MIMTRNMSVNGQCTFRRHRCDKSRKDFKIQRPYTGNTEYVECSNKSGTSNNRGNRNHVKTIQKIPQQHTSKARHQVTTQNSHTVHCTYTAESADVQYKTFVVGNYTYCTLYCNHGLAVTIVVIRG